MQVDQDQYADRLYILDSLIFPPQYEKSSLPAFDKLPIEKLKVPIALDIRISNSLVQKDSKQNPIINQNKTLIDQDDTRDEKTEIKQLINSQQNVDVNNQSNQETQDELMIIRDRFEWDLTSGLRPIDFAKNLVDSLQLQDVNPQQIADDISDQIIAFVCNDLYLQMGNLGAKSQTSYLKGQRGRKPRQIHALEQFEKAEKTYGACHYCNSRMAIGAQGCNHCMLDVFGRCLQEPLKQYQMPKDSCPVRTCPKCKYVNLFIAKKCLKCPNLFTNDNLKTRAQDDASYPIQELLQQNTGYNKVPYAVHFWDGLQAVCPLFSSEEFTQLFNTKLTKKDFDCVRDLYKKVKSVLMEIDLDDYDMNLAQFFDVSACVDFAFEMFVTDNQATRMIFEHSDSIALNKLQRNKVTFSTNYNRPYNTESQVPDLLLKLKKQNKFSLETKRALGMPEEQQISPSGQQHPFKTVRVDRTSHSDHQQQIDLETFLNLSINNETASHSVTPQQQQQQQVVLRPVAAQQQQVYKTIFKQQINPYRMDGKCDMCQLPGTVLVKCIRCPVAFHRECLGFGGHLAAHGPRGKWLCYFCKVLKFGLNDTETKSFTMCPAERDLVNEYLIIPFNANKFEGLWQPLCKAICQVLIGYSCSDGFRDDIVNKIHDRIQIKTVNQDTHDQCGNDANDNHISDGNDLDQLQKQNEQGKTSVNGNDQELNGDHSVDSQKTMITSYEEFLGAMLTVVPSDGGARSFHVLKLFEKLITDPRWKSILQ